MVTGVGCACEPEAVVDEELTGLDVAFALEAVPEVTQVRLSVHFEDDETMPVLEPLVRPNEEAGALRPEENLLVLLDDDLGGARVLVKAEGLVGGRIEGRGRGSVRVAAGELTTVRVVLCPRGRAYDGDDCRAGCFIDGVLREPGEPNPDDPCLHCDPMLDEHDWSARPEGGPCGDGLYCDSAGECRAGCVVDDELFDPGDIHPTEPCRSCEPEDGVHGWRDWEEGAPCGDGMYCDTAGECREGCVVDGGFREPGRLHPDEECLTCIPGEGQDGWAPRSEGAFCGDGWFCDGEGLCVEGCFIGDTVYAEGEMDDPDDPCGVCHPRHSTSQWSWTEAFSVAVDGGESWVVPDGVEEVTVEAWGGGGGGGGASDDRAGGDGGGGGFAYDEVAVTPGESLTVRVGGGGAGGGRNTGGSYNAGRGGGGGGYSGLTRARGFGHDGGSSYFETARNGGGGGAGGPGLDGESHKAGDGGSGMEFPRFAAIGGSPAGWFGGGGGGGTVSDYEPGEGGLGGGGAGGVDTPGASAEPNTGGGGGGGGGFESGGAGGSGIVTVRYTSGTLVATGGTQETVDGYEYHTFTSVGAFELTVTSGSGLVEALVVAGGGAGGASGDSGRGGGGAGGIVNPVFLVSEGSYSVVVGAGGTPGESTQPGGNGDNSAFGPFVAWGGGGSGPYDTAGQPGGSGGGGSGRSGQIAGGLGFQPRVVSSSVPVLIAAGGGGGGGGNGESGGVGAHGGAGGGWGGLDGDATESTMGGGGGAQRNGGAGGEHDGSHGRFLFGGDGGSHASSYLTAGGLNGGGDGGQATNRTGSRRPGGGGGGGGYYGGGGGGAAHERWNGGAGGGGGSSFASGVEASIVEGNGVWPGNPQGHGYEGEAGRGGAGGGNGQDGEPGEDGLVVVRYLVVCD